MNHNEQYYLSFVTVSTACKQYIIFSKSPSVSEKLSPEHRIPSPLSVPAITLMISSSCHYILSVTANQRTD